MSWLPNGFGSELSLALMLIGASALWVIRRQFVAWERKLNAIENRQLSKVLAEHDEMYNEFLYQKRREESSGRHMRE